MRYRTVCTLRRATNSKLVFDVVKISVEMKAEDYASLISFMGNRFLRVFCATDPHELTSKGHLTLSKERAPQSPLWIESLATSSLSINNLRRGDENVIYIVYYEGSGLELLDANAWAEYGVHLEDNQCDCIEICSDRLYEECDV